MSAKEATNPDDPKGLIRESYRIEGISDGECRSILTEWALSLTPDQDEGAAIAALLARHAAQEPEHPMTALLLAAQAAPPVQPRRRGGRAGRFREG